MFKFSKDLIVSTLLKPYFTAVGTACAAGLCTGMDRRAADGVWPCFRCEDRLCQRRRRSGRKTVLYLQEETEMILIVAAMEEDPRNH